MEKESLDKYYARCFDDLKKKECEQIEKNKKYINYNIVVSGRC